MPERPLSVSWFENAKGERFRTLRWAPADPCDDLVLVHHGHGEHAGRYTSWARALAEMPVDFRAYDLRGHGESVGKRGDAEGGLDGLIDDFEAVLPWMLEQSGASRVFVLAHSLGGATLARYLTTRTPHPAIAGVIFSAPFLRNELNFVVQAKAAAGRVLNRVVPKLTLDTGLDPSGISSVASEQRRYLEDPLVHSKISARLGKSLLDDPEKAIAAAGVVTLPVFLLHGQDDPIAAPDGTRAFARNLGSADKTLREFPGLRHEAHHEGAGAEPVFEAVREWLAPRLGGASAAAATPQDKETP